MKRLSEYEIYHRRVVEECVELMGEDSREFYAEECTYFEEFAQGIEPRQVAREQLDAMRELVTEADQRAIPPVQADLLGEENSLPNEQYRDPGEQSKKPAGEKPRRRYRVI